MSLALELVTEISKGNAGAVTICCRLLKEHGPQFGAVTLLALKAQGCLGPDIWIRYKDECGEDLDKFIDRTLGDVG